jgi:hypothetical protein
MGLKATISKAIKGGFKSLGDIPTLFTYTSVAPGVYDPVLDETDDVETVYTNVQGLLTSLSEEEVTWFPADRVTQKVILPMEGLTFDPKGDDYLTIDGVVWQIRRVKDVPGKSVAILFIQEP